MMLNGTWNCTGRTLEIILLTLTLQSDIDSWVLDVVVDVSVCQSEDMADDDSTSTRNVVTQDTVTEQ